jgi:hypothetical protein
MRLHLEEPVWLSGFIFTKFWSPCLQEYITYEIMEPFQEKER